MNLIDWELGPHRTAISIFNKMVFGNVLKMHYLSSCLCNLMAMEDTDKVWFVLCNVRVHNVELDGNETRP